MQWGLRFFNKDNKIAKGCNTREVVIITKHHIKLSVEPKSGKFTRKHHIYKPADRQPNKRYRLSPLLSLYTP